MTITRGDKAILILAAVILALLVSFVKADEHHHPAEDAAIHETFYKDWTRPNEPKVGCCNKEDCFPTKFKNYGGTWYALVNHGNEDDVEAWVPIPLERFEHNRLAGPPRDNPDGRNHVCLRKVGETYYVFCAIFGAGL